MKVTPLGITVLGLAVTFLLLLKSAESSAASNLDSGLQDKRALEDLKKRWRAYGDIPRLPRDERAVEDLKKRWAVAYGFFPSLPSPPQLQDKRAVKDLKKRWPTYGRFPRPPWTQRKSGDLGIGERIDLPEIVVQINGGRVNIMTEKKDPGTWMEVVEPWTTSAVQKLHEEQLAGCEDRDPKCQKWAARGKCTKDPKYMRVCQSSCNQCGKTTVAPRQRRKLTKWWDGSGEESSSP
ncbi:uncharacterized protein LOC143295505 isoform X2 [Babylonia areolata]|uniref:uncharacterized protein LOC143295505 isoform X2 n=1 Tax=Babylonia areolata TaxID=304850 RepID=UPI003FCEF10D